MKIETNLGLLRVRVHVVPVHRIVEVPGFLQLPDEGLQRFSGCRAGDDVVAENVAGSQQA